MLLALDTATRLISIALHDGGHVVAEATWETANHHTVELAPAVEAMLSRAGLRPESLTAVAVALGPGSFTGLRIGLGLAKGLATALDIPLVGIPTLEVLAAAQPEFPGDLIAVLSAGRGRLCVQRFHWETNAWAAAGEASIMSWDALLEGIPEGAPTLLSGEIAPEAVQKIVEAGASGKTITLAPTASRLRRAGYLADLAQARLRAGAADDPYTLVPIYLHQPGVPHP